VLVLFSSVFQALAWTPFAQRWIQGILTVFAGAGTFGWVVGGIAFGFDRFGSAATPLAALTSVALVFPLAYYAALSGVAMTRRGDSYDWRLWNRFIERLNIWRKPADHPFRSSSAAQVWFELRSCGWYPLVMNACMFFFFCFLLLSDPSDIAQTWKFLGIFLGLPVFMATVAGGALGNIGGIEASAKSSHESFLFSRPIASSTVVRDKLLMGALATLGIWLLAVPSGLLFLLRPGFFQALLDIARQTPAWKLALLPPLAVLLLLATTWKQLVEGYWVALTGRPWLTNVFTIGVVLFVMFSVGFGIAAAIFPEYQAAAKTAAPWILGVLLVAKITVAIVVLRAIVQSGIMPIEFVVAAVASWVFVVAVLASLALWLVPPNAASMNDMLGGIILFVPFSRLMGAPLAVEWNRHR
jgi:hypothetical protein